MLGTGYVYFFIQNSQAVHLRVEEVSEYVVKKRGSAMIWNDKTDTSSDGCYVEFSQSFSLYGIKTSDMGCLSY